MKSIIINLMGVILLLGAGQSFAHDSNSHTSTKKLKLENLMRAKLAGVKGTEVIVSRVTIPANTRLPKHWHPGEEFAYILKGSVVLWQKGKKDITGRAGDVVKVPLKQEHTAVTKSEPVELLIFRVHEEGQPERIKVK